MFNKESTCWNCPACEVAGQVDFKACGQSIYSNDKDVSQSDNQVMVKCRRRPELGQYDPFSVIFEDCPEYKKTKYGYMLKNMKVMILGIDGYLGWTLALWLGKLGCKVSGIDNYNRRKWVKERGSHTIVPIAKMTDRLHAAKEILNIDINFREMDIIDSNRLKGFLEDVKPEAIVHYAECPSAPYSMIDVEHATLVQNNNVIGTLRLLFNVRDNVPDSAIIKLGTMGEYGSPLTGRPIFEGMFPGDATLKWDNREWSLGGELTPRDPVSFYHVSKVQDTFNMYEACKYWWLKAVDVMQGVIYGVHTDEVAADSRLRTRFDIDEWFGTVINRYVAQSVVGIPLTVYGAGGQTRGFIALRDAMECMTRLLIKQPEPGQYEVVNQISGVYNIMNLAKTVAKIGRKEFGLDINIQRIENPRVEADKHPFEVIYNKLPDDYDFSTNISLEEEIYSMFKLLTTDEIKKRIEEKKHLIYPKTWWSGVKKESRQIELIKDI